MKILNNYNINHFTYYKNSARFFKGKKETISQASFENKISKNAVRFVKQMCKEAEAITVTDAKTTSGNKGCVRLEIKNPNVNKNLFDYKKYFMCFFGEDHNIREYYVYDNKDETVSITKGERTIDYSKADIQALYFYKNFPSSIHSKLRNKKDIYSAGFLRNPDTAIENLDKIFKDKTFTTESDIVLYRALEDDLSDEDKKSLHITGGIFQEKSFCSTSTLLQIAKSFKGKNPILKINVPKGTKYIDIDKVFNINRERWHEFEFLLNRGVRFQVVGFLNDDIIEVNLLSDN